MEGPNTLNYVHDTIDTISKFIAEATENIDIRNKNVNENVGQLI